MESVSNHHSPTPLLAADKPAPSASVSTKSPAVYHVSVAWFHKLTIEQRVLAGFSMVFVGILIISSISYRNTSILLANSGLNGRSHDLIQLLNNIDAAMGEAEDVHRRYLVTGEGAYLEAYKKIVRQKPTFTAYLHELVRGSPEQQQRVGVLDGMMDRPTERRIESSRPVSRGRLPSRQEHGLRRRRKT